MSEQIEDRFVDIETVVDLSDVIEALRDLSPEELLRLGYSTDDTWDEIDDPLLIGRDGLPIETWREGYPYDQRMTRQEYDVTKRLLQIEMLKVQRWVKESSEKVVVLFEGRDAAGKGGSIARFTQNLNPRGARWWWRCPSPTTPSAGSGTSSGTSSTCRARGSSSSSTAPGTTAPASRSWMGYCTAQEYGEFLRQVTGFETVRSSSRASTLFKLWFAVSRREPERSASRTPPERSVASMEDVPHRRGPAQSRWEEYNNRA